MTEIEKRFEEFRKAMDKFVTFWKKKERFNLTKTRSCDFCEFKTTFSSTIDLKYRGKVLVEIAICPQCRIKHTIFDLYKKALEKQEAIQKQRLVLWQC